MDSGHVYDGLLQVYVVKSIGGAFTGVGGS